MSGGGRTARPFCHGWCQWVVWGCSSAVIPHRTARPQTRECKWGAMCNMRQGTMRARRPGGGDRWRNLDENIPLARMGSVGRRKMQHCGEFKPREQLA